MEQYKDLISIIIPTYNSKDYISRVIESVISQSYKHLEFIIIDDGSNDGTAKICDEYVSRDSRIRVIHQKNRGISDS